MKKLSKAFNSTVGVRGPKYALIDHDHTEYLDKESPTLQEVKSDLVFTGNIYGLDFRPPSVDTVVERNNIPEDVRFDGLIVYVKDLEASYQLKGGLGNDNWKPLISDGSSWGGIKGNIEDQIDLIAELSKYAELSHTHSIEDINGLRSEIDSKAGIEHNHAIEDIQGLEEALLQTAPINHDHAIENVLGLQDVLDGKSNVQHKHVLSEISNLKEFSGDVPGLVPDASNAAPLAFLRSDGVWVETDEVEISSSWGDLSGNVEDQTDLVDYITSAVDLSVFSDTDKGLVPPSEGILSGFLSVNGTWELPESPEVTWDSIQGGIENYAPLTALLSDKSNVGHTHSINSIDNLAFILDSKVDASKVLTDVPENAVFTDTTYGVFNSSVNGLVPAPTSTQGKVLSDSGGWIELPDTATWGNIQGNLSDQADLVTALLSKADASSVLTPVPENALFTDTVYVKPLSEPIEYIDGLLDALNSKVDNIRVLTDVPENALFTDTTYSAFSTNSEGLVPSPAGESNKFLRSDGAWVTVSGGGGGASAAVDVTVAPSGNLTSTNAQEAFEELQNSIDANSAKEKTLTQPGILEPFTGNARWYPRTNVSIKNVVAALGTSSNDGNVEIAVKKNGLTVYSLTVSSGSNLSSVATSEVALLVSDYLTVDVINAGNNSSAKDMTVTFRYEVS